MWVRLLEKLEPVRALPIAVRYGMTALIVLVCFGLRWSMGEMEENAELPVFLMLVPSVILAAFLFDRGSGFVAVALSAVLGTYFFVPPELSMRVASPGHLLQLIAFLVVGVITAALVEALRKTVDDLRLANIALRASQATAESRLSALRAVMNGVPEPIFVKDLEGRLVHVNPAMARVMGSDVDHVLGRPERDFLPADEVDAIRQHDREVMTARRVLVTEQAVTGTTDKRTYLTTKAPWLGVDGSVLGVVGVAWDIDERKRREESLQSASTRKDVLLGDIQHRVKNHLQSVAALLYASQRETQDPVAREALRTATARLQVLARVYDRLRLDTSGVRVNLGQFASELCLDLGATVTDKVFITVQCNQLIEVSSQRAVVVGLILNEVITNALKHAFPDDAAGQILITLEKVGATCRVTVADNGVGLPQELAAGRGRNLIQSLAHQVSGEVVWTSNDGTSVELTFPLSETGE